MLDMDEATVFRRGQPFPEGGGDPFRRWLEVVPPRGRGAGTLRPARLVLDHRRQRHRCAPHMDLAEIADLDRRPAMECYPKA